jgi:vanillate O-demethylase ferredoxin subunit
MTARLIMRLRVEAVRASDGGVRVFTLRHTKKPVLPGYAAGAHVDLRLPDGRMRQYSLCGDPTDPSVYVLAIKREEAGRGASVWAHEALKVGAEVLVSAPRNNFPLAEGAARHVLVAGGIGITPLLAMARQLAQEGADFVLHYSARSRAAPLLAEVRAVCGNHLVTHFSDNPDDARFDPAALGAAEPGVHVYCCGPQRLTDAVRQAVADWPEAQVHFEVFQPTADENFKPEPFNITLRSTGETLLVPADRSALDVLREHGQVLPSSCELGVCGSCICGYSGGVVVHRDSVLGVAARQDRMMLCVSRARVGVTLDL